MSWLDALPVPADIREMIHTEMIRISYAEVLREFNDRSDGTPVSHSDVWPWDQSKHPLLCGRKNGYTMNMILTVERYHLELCEHSNSDFHHWNGRQYRFWPFLGMNRDLARHLCRYQTTRMPSRQASFNDRLLNYHHTLHYHSDSEPSEPESEPDYDY